MVEATNNYRIPYTYKKIFSHEECNEIIKFFKNADTSKDGMIQADEMKNILKQMGRDDISEQKIQELLKKYDRNGDSVIDFNEFLEMFSNFKDQQKGHDQVQTEKGGASMAQGVRGHHIFLHEEVKVITRLFNKVLAKDEYVKDRVPMGVDAEELFHAMSDGMMLIRILASIDKESVDMRAVNKGEQLSIFKVRENIDYGLTCAQGKIRLIGINASIFLDKVPHLVLGVAWQLARQVAVQSISLKDCPEIYRLAEEGEELTELAKKKPEDILVRWINFHLKAAGQEFKVQNLGKDLVDCKAMFYLCNQLTKGSSSIENMEAEDTTVRATQMIANFTAMGVPEMVDPEDWLKGNGKINSLFVAEIFNTKHGLEELKEEEIAEVMDKAGIIDDDIAGTREERQFRLWINSLGIQDVFINDLFSECRTGMVLLSVIHEIDNTAVDWKRVEKNANNMFKVGINCQVCIDACANLKLKLIGIGAQDIQEGHKKLTLAIVWQLMRCSYLKIIGSKTEADLLKWCNESVPDMNIANFKDKSLADGVFLIKLLATIEPRIIDWDLVKMEGASEEEKQQNAKYAISLARKLGAVIFLVWDDILEVNMKMMVIFIASLYHMKEQMDA